LPGGCLSGAAVQDLARSFTLFCLSLAMLAPVSVKAGNPEVPGTGGVIELEHAIELSVEPEGATLQVTRTLFNAGITHGQVELPIPLPCSATLDQVAIEEQDGHGELRWKAAELIDATEAVRRWSTWLDGPGEGVATTLDADAALHLRRNGYNCEALLEVYPVPPVHTRRVSYRVFVPSRYVDGHHEIELPSFAAYGEIASLTVTAGIEPDFPVQLDGKDLMEDDVMLAGDQAHVFSLWRRDAGHGAVRSVDLDLAGLIASTPSASARLEPDEVPGRLLSASLEAPRELASLPPVRRVVVLLDTSRSLGEAQRLQLQQLGARYLELLGETMRVEVEVVLFDRELRRVYHDFVPGTWAAEDLRDLEVGEHRNGSELDAAIVGARALLDSPSASEGVDWVLVLSDLYLRSSYPLAEELDAAAHSSTRMHVVRPTDDGSSFHPGQRDEAWSMISRETGGMLWYASGYELDEMARELIAPTRIWSLRLELALAGDEHREVALADWHAAGATSDWLDDAHTGPALERAAFVGDVWGQRRAWTATPSDADARRLAGALATSNDHGLSDASRTALAFHARVVSPFTSAWALASFAGPASAPTTGYGFGSAGGWGHSTRCGGVRSSGRGGLLTNVTIGQLVQHALDSCPNAKAGTLVFESTDLEIVDVITDDRCIREHVWEIDLSPTRPSGRQVVTVEHAGGKLDTLDQTELGYRDLTMPTPNITTNTASGMK
jgi:hypothetical protein